MSVRAFEPNLDFMKKPFTQTALLENLQNDLNKISETLSPIEKDQFAHYIEAVNLIKNELENFNKVYNEDDWKFTKTRALIKAIKKSKEKAQEFIIQQIAKAPAGDIERIKFLKEIAPDFQKQLHPLLRGVWIIGGKDSVDSNPTFPIIKNDADRKFVELILSYLKALNQNINKFKPDNYIVKGPIGAIISLNGGFDAVVGKQIGGVIEKLEKRVEVYKKKQAQNSAASARKVVNVKSETSVQSAESVQPTIKAVSKKLDNKEQQERVLSASVDDHAKIKSKQQPNQQIEFVGIEEIRQQNELSNQDDFVMDLLNLVLNETDPVKKTNIIAETGLSDELREISLSEVKEEEERERKQFEEQFENDIISPATRNRAGAVTGKPEPAPITWSREDKSKQKPQEPTNKKPGRSPYKPNK